MVEDSQVSQWVPSFLSLAPAAAGMANRKQPVAFGVMDDMRQSKGIRDLPVVAVGLSLDLRTARERERVLGRSGADRALSD